MSLIKVNETKIDGVFNIIPYSSYDSRGFSVKDYDKNALNLSGIMFEPCEIMIIESKKNVLRGLHFQYGEKQDKIVRCINGSVWAVVVDLRKESKTLGQWINVNINSNSEVYLPGGCALGTLAMEDSFILCMFGEMYDGKRASGVRWNDDILNVDWPIEYISGDIIISEKDSSLMSFKDYLISVGKNDLCI